MPLRCFYKRGDLMADTIQLRGGTKEKMPNLADREPGYCRDEEALYIGTPDGNVKLGGKTEDALKALDLVCQGFGKDIQKLHETAQRQGEELGKKLTAEPVAAQAALAADADLAAVIAAVNALLDAMKQSGVMST